MLLFLFHLCIVSHCFICRAPAVQGMFIAMKKDFFLELGGFDTGMEIWGAEQMELSIKVHVSTSRLRSLFRFVLFALFVPTFKNKLTIKNINYPNYITPAPDGAPKEPPQFNATTIIVWLLNSINILTPHFIFAYIKFLLLHPPQIQLLQKLTNAIHRFFFRCKNMKHSFEIKTFLIFLLKTLIVEPPRRCGLNKYPQSLFWTKNKKIVNPFTPHFYNIKVRFWAYSIHGHAYCKGCALFTGVVMWWVCRECPMFISCPSV